jgi:hypothetical protein
MITKKAKKDYKLAQNAQYVLKGSTAVEYMVELSLCRVLLTKREVSGDRQQVRRQRALRRQVAIGSK